MIRTIKWFLIAGLLVGVLLTRAPSAIAAPHAICVSIATGGWNTAGNWSCFGASGVPSGVGTDVFIQSGHTITVDTSVVIGNITVEGSLLGGPINPLNAQNVSVKATFNTALGATTTVNNLTVESAGAMTLNNLLQVNGALIVNGTFSGNGQNASIVGDVTINAGGTFNAGAGILTLQANLSNSGTFNDNSGTIAFTSGAPQTIGGTTGMTFNNLTINKSANDVILGNNTTINGVMALTAGDLETGGNTLTMGASATTTGNRDVEGTVKRVNPGTGAKSYGSQFTTLDFSSAVTGDVIVTMLEQAPAGLGTKYVKRKYTLTVPGGNTATVRLHYRDADLNDPPVLESNLMLFRYDSSAGRWVMLIPTTRSTGGTDDNYIEKTGVATFSEWAMSSEASPTAVRLNDFTARANELPDWLAFAIGGVISLIVVAGTLRSRK